jgi:uncharacterized repeat protein (TIGR01451 family)
MRRFFIFFAVSAILFLISHSVTNADITCQPIYGGGQSCVTANNIAVNKTILNPQTNQFVDSLSINDSRYQPGFVTTFQISVTNTGNSNIEKIDVKDIFPQYVSFGSGAGTFDSNTNTLTFSLDNLAPNETRKYSIVGRILNADQIPIASGSTICVVNRAIAMVDNANVSQDNAQFCIEKTLTPTAAETTVTTVTATKGGFPVLSSVSTKSSPKTGPESLALLALIPTGIAGWMLRKYSMKKEVAN